MNKYYLTTAIPYVNGRAHIGHTLEYFQADTIRRFHQLLGDEVLLLSGADENALKNVQAAQKEGIPVQDYLDKYSQIWKDTYELVGVHLDVFQRGSDKEKHWPGVQKLWKLCQDSEDIYKKAYEGFYCVGCESFKTEAELENGLCPIHKTKPDFIREENYFFKLSKYQDKLVELIESGDFKITPENKKAEALSFIKGGLEDFSISRSNERAQGVGVPVPGDDTQKIYVWFDALTIYMTGIGFGWDDEKWAKWWPADLHVIGKDINRFHTVYWPAMLLSAGLPLPKQILIHGFVNAKGGEKFSKSLGNAPEPKEVIEKYGLEPVRYFMLSQIPINGDGDFDPERFEEVYNADLANGLGNLVARVARLCEKNDIKNIEPTVTYFDPTIEDHLKSFHFNEAIGLIWAKIGQADRKINETKPWELETAEVKPILEDLVNKIQEIAFNLQPFLPETAEKILDQFSGEIKSAEPLFPRI
jgi:methionyl-tRNA synthetase